MNIIAGYLFFVVLIVVNIFVFGLFYAYLEASTMSFDLDLDKMNFGEDNEKDTTKPTEE